MGLSVSCLTPPSVSVVWCQQVARQPSVGPPTPLARRPSLPRHRHRGAWCNVSPRWSPESSQAGLETPGPVPPPASPREIPHRGASPSMRVAQLRAATSTAAPSPDVTRSETCLPASASMGLSPTETQVPRFPGRAPCGGSPSITQPRSTSLYRATQRRLGLGIGVAVGSSSRSADLRRILSA